MDLPMEAYWKVTCYHISDATSIKYTPHMRYNDFTHPVLVACCRTERECLLGVYRKVTSQITLGNNVNYKVAKQK
jgi:hypothetical protein